MTTEVDRRKFLKYTGAAGASTGAFWMAPSVLGSSTAFAAGSCNCHAQLAWNSYGLPDGAHEPSGTSTVSFALAAPSTDCARDAHVEVIVTPVGSPDDLGGTYGGINVDGAGNFNGSLSYYQIEMTTNQGGVGFDMTFNFYSGTTGTNPINVYNLAFALFDIDQSTSTAYDDIVWISGSPNVVSKGIEVAGDGTATTPWQGTSSNGVTDNSSRVELQYAGPVNSFTYSYRSSDTYNGGGQAIGISDLTWCY